MSERTSTSSIANSVLAGLLICSLPSAVLASSECVTLTGCERKFCKIEAQLSRAVEEGNERRAGGLRESLRNARSGCSAQGLEADLRDAIEDAREDLKEYEADLREAQEDGEVDKVQKYQEKIGYEKGKLKRLNNELSELHK